MTVMTTDSKMQQYYDFCMDVHCKECAQRMQEEEKKAQEEISKAVIKDDKGNVRRDGEIFESETVTLETK